MHYIVSPGAETPSYATVPELTFSVDAERSAVPLRQLSLVKSQLNSRLILVWSVF